MGRIPEAELERIKRETDLVALARAALRHSALRFAPGPVEPLALARLRIIPGLCALALGAPALGGLCFAPALYITKLCKPGAPAGG